MVGVSDFVGWIVMDFFKGPIPGQAEVEMQWECNMGKGERLDMAGCARDHHTKFAFKIISVCIVS